jgi:molybdate transport system substrate-binding protein
VATIRILGAGAAQAALERIARAFERETGHRVQAEFSAVGAMKARVAAGEPVDVIVLTRALVDELAAGGLVRADTRTDLGRVGTGVAVRKGAPLPAVAEPAALRAALLAAARIVCPDPATATAGKIVLRTLERLGAKEALSPRLVFFPNGYAAMRWLAESGGADSLGITQITEIRANPGVTCVGPLPEPLQARTVYTAALAARPPCPEAAREFLGRLAEPAARPVLAEAGFELGD